MLVKIGQYFFLQTQITVLRYPKRTFCFLC